MENKMNETPEKFPITSQIPLEERLKALNDLIPEAFSEGKIDFGKLRSALGESVDSSSERYGLSWAGKSEAIRAVQIPSRGTLEPMPDKSINFDTSQNMIIEGDNLEVLKLLQKSYYGKIKMIYIDPPYNTAGDFIYPDNFREGLEDYLIYSGQRADDGTRLSSNEERGGRKHSKWLNMMYPRLFLARNLLREDGVIFISIDDNEVTNLKALCNEIFGEENFIAQNIRVSNSAKNQSTFVSVTHDYTLIYCRSKDAHTSTNWKVPKSNLGEFLSVVRRLTKSELSFDEISDELRKLTKYPRFYEFDHYYYVDKKFDKLGPYATDKPGPTGIGLFQRTDE
jgi:adenine-specific DNA-methyltransferase